MKSRHFGYRHPSVKRPLFIIICVILAAPLLLTPRPALAIGEKLISQLIDSDFIFSRASSNAPFLPIAALEYSRFNAGDCRQSNTCEANHTNASQLFGLPVWIGQKDMIVVGETINYESLSRFGRELDVISGGAVLAWGRQYSAKTQIAAFYFSKLLYVDTDYGDAGLESVGSTTGFVARYEKNNGVHWYWGGIRDDSNGSILILPYLGLDWQVNKQWSVSAIMPWPSIHYAPAESGLSRWV